MAGSAAPEPSLSQYEPLASKAQLPCERYWKRLGDSKLQTVEVQ